MKTELLFLYLQDRTRRQDTELLATILGLEAEFNNGFRSFFGVTVNDIGFPLWDDHEPRRGYLNNFICWELISRRDPTEIQPDLGY